LPSDGWKVLQEHGHAVHALLLRLTLRRDVADDLLHDLFIKLAGRIARTKDPAAYMCRAAINLAMDWRRTQRRRPVSAISRAQQRDPCISLEHADEIERILDAAENLSDLERQVSTENHLQIWTGKVLGPEWFVDPATKTATKH